MINFSISQLDSIWFDFCLIAIYLVAIPLSKSQDLPKCLLAVVACQVYGLSPMYNYTLTVDPSMVLLVYASVYFTAIRFLSSYKVIAACFIMALFEGIMYKAYLNELGHQGLENSLYDNYKAIVTFLHVAIVFQVVQWPKLRFGARFLRDNLLRPLLHSRLLLPYRG